MMQHAVQGTIPAPPSKSITHRAYLLAAQSVQPCTVGSPLLAGDTDAMLRSLRDLGAEFAHKDQSVMFRPATFEAPSGPLDCANSGTALRLLTGTVARMGAMVSLDGDASLRRRPNQHLLDALRQLGAEVRSGPDGACPVAVRGPLRAGEVSVRGDLSSQFTSSLLLTLPMLDGASTLHVQNPPVSRHYVDLTMRVAAPFGLTIEQEGDTFHVAGDQRPSATSIRVEGDWSSAAFPLAAAAITEGNVTVQGLDPTSAQADRAFLHHLQAFGAQVTVAPGAVTVQGDALDSPGSLDVSQAPDLFPILCVLAACSRGTTAITGAAALRVKESDRITAMIEGLRAVGIRVEERPDGVVVHGGTPTGGTVHAHQDHRIHMAFQVLALAASGAVHVDGAATVDVSYPQFPEHLRRLTEGAP